MSLQATFSGRIIGSQGRHTLSSLVDAAKQSSNVVCKFRLPVALPKSPPCSMFSPYSQTFYFHHCRDGEIFYCGFVNIFLMTNSIGHFCICLLTIFVLLLVTYFVDLLLILKSKVLFLCEFVGFLYIFYTQPLLGDVLQIIQVLGFSLSILSLLKRSS